ncbi:uncharacterized protein EDB91DRAFT_1082378 [Suillus paluster]|uniref:uncharacterized protein n=1 Tax=Suillus paluster TaxID=48578 RepID=UPI001B86565E|nr:uncharacterized protein EDB91DRAFT_1082378 [Suillus paluster]KAG1739437.1 hypothetical protein EDB91DRAFT_1082378 [Suillus paluster]
MSEPTSSPAGNTLEENGITTRNMIARTTPNAINAIEHSVRSTRDTTDGPNANAAILPSEIQATDIEVLASHSTAQTSHEGSTSPELSSYSPRLPPTLPTSPWLSSLGSSLVNTPALPLPTELSTEDQMSDSEFVVPTLEIEIVLPLAASIVSSSNLPAVHDSLEFVPASRFTSSASSLPSAVKLESVSNLDEPVPPTIILDSSDTNTSSDFIMDFSLSDTFIVEMTDTADCYLGVTKPEIVDLYSISDDLEEVTESVPFTTQAILYGPGGKTSCFQVNVDDGAMVNVIDLKVFHKVERNLKRLIRSNQSLRMADRSIVPSHGLWQGTFQWNKVKIRTSFKVFDSGGAWSMLIGKPLLEQLGAKHDYAQDAITILYQPSPIIMYNIYGTTAAPIPKTRTPPELAVHDNGGDDLPFALIFLIVTIPPDEIADSSSQEKHGQSIPNTEHYVFEVDVRVTKDQLELRTEGLARAGAHVVQADQWPIVSLVTEQAPLSPCSPVSFTATETKVRNANMPIWPVLNRLEHEMLGEVPEFPTASITPSVYSRHTNPFNPV